MRESRVLVLERLVQGCEARSVGLHELSEFVLRVLVSFERVSDRGTFCALLFLLLLAVLCALGSFALSTAFVDLVLRGLDVRVQLLQGILVVRLELRSEFRFVGTRDLSRLLRQLLAFVPVTLALSFGYARIHEVEVDEVGRLAAVVVNDELDLQRNSERAIGREGRGLRRTERGKREEIPKRRTPDFASLMETFMRSTKSSAVFLLCDDLLDIVELGPGGHSTAIEGQKDRLVTLLRGPRGIKHC